MEISQTATLATPRATATRAGIGYSDDPNSHKAGAEAARGALERAGVSACDLVILYSTSKHDPSALHEGVRSVVGRRPRLIGGYAVGVITNDWLGYEGHQVGVAVISSESLKVDMFMETGLNEGEHAVGVRLGRQIQAGRYEGEPNLLLMYDAIKQEVPEGFSLNTALPLLQGISEALPEWPNTAGVGMMGDLMGHHTYQWFDDRVEQQAALALVLHGGVRMDTVIMHGCRPSGAYHTITATEGAVVLEIDGKPALDAISEMLGPYGNKDWEEYPLYVTLGVNKGDKFGEFREQDYANRLVMAIDKSRRALVMFEPDLTAGTEVQLMRRSINFEYVGQRTRELFARIGERRPFFALYIDCAGRASIYCGTESEEAEEVQRAVGPDIPLLGVYSGVEIAKVGNHVQPLDWTGVLCVFSE